MTATDTRTVTATIARVNGRGFTTQEQPNSWLNLSRYAKPAPTIPPSGTEVRLTIDGDGYVRAIELVPAPPASSQPQAPRPTTAAPTKDQSIVRMAAVKAAAHIGGQGSTAENVLELAAKLEAWISR